MMPRVLDLAVDATVLARLSDGEVGQCGGVHPPLARVELRAAA